MSEQQQPQLYQYGVKIEMTTKGLAMATIHVYSNDMQTARKQAVEQYSKVIEELKAKTFASSNSRLQNMSESVPSILPLPCTPQ